MSRLDLDWNRDETRSANKFQVGDRVVVFGTPNPEKVKKFLGASGVIMNNNYRSYYQVKWDNPGLNSEDDYIWYDRDFVYSVDNNEQALVFLKKE